MRSRENAVAATPTPATHVEVRPDAGRVETEVLERARRRRFTAEYKREIVRAAAACREAGEVGALLRREGLYSSHLSQWRQQVESAELRGLMAKKRGRKAKQQPTNAQAEEIERLRRENERLKKRLDEAETIIALQKKLSEMLGISLENKKSGEDA